MAWDYPVFIVAMFFLAMGIALVIMRVANPRRRRAAFECSVCGRREAANSAKDWRYCPYCGVPRDSRSMRDLPRRGVSILDIE